MNTNSTVRLSAPAAIKRRAAIRAAQRGLHLHVCVGDPIEADCDNSSVAEAVSADKLEVAVVHGLDLIEAAGKTFSGENVYWTAGQVWEAAASSVDRAGQVGSSGSRRRMTRSIHRRCAGASRQPELLG